MRRLGLVLVVCAGVTALLVVTASSGGTRGRPLPLRAPAAATGPLLGLVSGQDGSRLARLDPATFAVVRSSKQVGWNAGWVRSPNGKLVAVATFQDGGDCSSWTLRFADASSLTWARRRVHSGGCFAAAIWPRPGTLYVLATDCCDAALTLTTVDVPARKIVAHRRVRGPLETLARSGHGLVLLTGDAYRIAPARLVAISPNGQVRSVPLERILAGNHWDQSGQDPIVTTRQPGLAVDPKGGVAYVVDAGGLAAAVRLRDLRVRYHELGSGSLLARLADWLTPPAEAKGVNGPTLSAQWLGDGLLAVAGSDQTAHSTKDGGETMSIVPAGLRIVDTHDWSVRVLDPQAETATVAGGLLLATGGRSHWNGSSNTYSGEGLAAYGPDRSLRWRIDSGAGVFVVAAYRTRAVIQKVEPNGDSPQTYRLVDLRTGRGLRTLTGWSSVWPLLGGGS